MPPGEKNIPKLLESQPTPTMPCPNLSTLPEPSQSQIRLLPPPHSSISTLYPHRPSSPTVPATFHDAMSIRLSVFCTEQGCLAAHELDDDDARSWHWVVYAAPSDRPIACLRLVPPPHPPHPNGFVDGAERPYVKLTRMAVVAEARGRGVAQALCEEAMGWAGRNAALIGEGWEGLVLVHAQVGVEGWWRGKVGFRTDERLGRWDEEGIEHLGMWRQIRMGDAKE